MTRKEIVINWYRLGKGWFWIKRKTLVIASSFEKDRLVCLSNELLSFRFNHLPFFFSLITFLWLTHITVWKLQIFFICTHCKLILFECERYAQFSCSLSPRSFPCWICNFLVFHLSWTLNSAVIEDFKYFWQIQYCYEFTHACPLSQRLDIKFPL